MLLGVDLMFDKCLNPYIIEFNYNPGFRGNKTKGYTEFQYKCCEDLIKYIPYFETKLVEDNFTKISPITQLCYVLPRISLDLLPNNIKEKLLLRKLCF